MFKFTLRAAAAANNSRDSVLAVWATPATGLAFFGMKECRGSNVGPGASQDEGLHHLPTYLPGRAGEQQEARPPPPCPEHQLNLSKVLVLVFWGFTF